MAAKMESGTWCAEIEHLKREVEELKLTNKDRMNNIKHNININNLHEFDIQHNENRNQNIDTNNNNNITTKCGDHKPSDDDSQFDVCSRDGVLKLDLSQMPSADWFTAPSVASGELFPDKTAEKENEVDLFSSFSPRARKSSIPDFTELDESDSDGGGGGGLLPTPPQPQQYTCSPTPCIKADSNDVARDSEPTVVVAVKWSDKISQLKEMFPHVPENQLKRCLSKSKSNLGKAVQTILASQSSPDGVKPKMKKEEAAKEDGSGVVCNEQLQADITRLKAMFPKRTESELHELYDVAGSLQGTMRLIVSEEIARKNTSPDKQNRDSRKFQPHQVSFKKKEFSMQDVDVMKKEISKKYSYSVEVPGKEHHPVVLVKKDSTKKVTNIFDDNDVKEAPLSFNPQVVEEKPEVTAAKQTNPKLKRKTRYR